VRVLDSQSGYRTATLALLVGNALPLAGLAAFGWRPVQALFVYWVEIGVTLLGYYVVVLFGQRESRPEQKGGGSYPGPVALGLPDRSVRPIPGLPPLRYRNLRYVPASVPLVALAWLLLSRAFLDFPNAGVVVSGEPTVESVFGYIAAASTPAGLALAAVTSTIQLAALWRDFLARGLVEQYSAAMLAELPARIAGVWFALTILLAPAYVGTILLETKQGVVGWGFLLVLVGLKLGVDLALVRLRYELAPGRVTRLFVPNTRESSA
jgi:hypothetical protein